MQKIWKKSNYALKEDDDETQDQNQGKDQVINLQEYMGETILKKSTLKISDGLNIT